MFLRHKITSLALCLFTSLVLSMLAAPCLAQGKGAVPLPMAKPAVDQLGQMEKVPGGDRTMLVLGLFLQMIALVAVASALAGHATVPKKKAVK